MRLTELDPQWIAGPKGDRIGFVFRSPTNRDQWQSCFVIPPKVGDQIDLFEALLGEDVMCQPCNPKAKWIVVGGIRDATFEAMTVSPSLDGSAGGLWHGHITNGEIKGGGV